MLKKGTVFSSSLQQKSYPVYTDFIIFVKDEINNQEKPSSPTDGRPMMIWRMKAGPDSYLTQGNIPKVGLRRAMPG